MKQMADRWRLRQLVLTAQISMRGPILNTATGNPQVDRDPNFLYCQPLKVCHSAYLISPHFKHSVTFVS